MSIETSPELNADENQEPRITEGTNPELAGLSSIEQDAYAKGWRPPTEFEGEDDKFVSAKEFLHRGPLFEKISKQSKELKGLRDSIKALAELNKSARTEGFTAALAELKAQKKEAFEDRDYDALEAADSQIKELNQKHAEEVENLNQVHKHEETAQVEIYKEWETANSWFVNNDVMAAYAKDIATDLRNKGETDVDSILVSITNKVKSKFPDYFRAGSTGRKSNVESSTHTTTANTGKASRRQLSAQDIKIMESVLAITPSLTEEKYIERLVKSRKR